MDSVMVAGLPEYTSKAARNVAEQHVMRASASERDQVSELEHTRQELELCQRKLDLVSSAENLGIWEIPSAGGPVIWNQVLRSLFLVEEAFEPGVQSWANLLITEDRARFLEAIEELGRTGREFENEFRLPVGSGEIRYLKITGRPLPGRSDGEWGSVGTVVDLTPHKLAATQTLRELEMAESGASAQSHFLARMSHEIRTSMNAILAPAQLLSEMVGDASQKEMVGMLMRAGEHLLHVINTILDFSKLEAGKMVLKTAPFEVESVVSDVLAPFEIIAEGKEVDLVHEIEQAARGSWIGDAARIRQMLLNLVSNAVKFTNRGEVGVRVSPWQSDEGVEGLEFEIRDSGPGISLDETEKIFLPFEQSPVQQGSCPSGTGLGLAICRELVDLMGGILGVDSIPGEGSQFWFRIPLQRADPAELDRAASEKRPPHAALPEWEEPPDVLVVEDNLSNRKVISLLLKKLGCRVSFAAEGHQALEALSFTRFDLVLMDCEMPGMDGFECSRKIRESEQNAAVRTPIVALSAHVGEDHVKRCMEAEMDDVLSKPISLAELRSTLAKFLLAPK